MFIRKKVIKGNEYAYLVENHWKEGRARQKVSKYLGRVAKPEKKAERTLQEHHKVGNARQYILNNDFRKIMQDLISTELFNHGLGNFDYNKGGVLQLNDGFLCGHTVNALLGYSGEDESGIKLAELITGAGLKIDKEMFVLLFEKIKQKKESKQAEEAINEGFKDFYY